MTILESSATGSRRDETGASLPVLLVGAVGVVFGDIGTSPLYAFREAIRAGAQGGAELESAVLGVLSLITWALILLVTGKYVLLLLRADNKGEGGTFALMSLAQSASPANAKLLLALGIVGASFFFGDAVITPAISVLSAVEGVQLIAPSLDHAVLPLSLAILVGLFAVQPFGTSLVASFFGPVMLAWFATLALSGLWHIAGNSGVLAALNPWHGFAFISSHAPIALAVLGLVFLAVTGAEAVYADLGHFGPRPIRLAWLVLVLPALLLNYYGQGALVLARPDAMGNPFFLLFPKWALVPIVLLATAATVIASQAVITGAFSLARQAIQLQLLPRLSVRHTSSAVSGQIYVGRVNWALLVVVVLATLLFETSSNLASAYGVAVTANMTITSFMTFFVLWRLWGWSLWKAALVIVPLLLLELIFFAANIIKLLEGAWLPVALAAILAVAMAIWRRGARALIRATEESDVDLAWLAGQLEASPPHRVEGTAVFLTTSGTSAPRSLLHNLKHNRVLHARNVVLTVQTEDMPRVARHARVEIERIGEAFFRVHAHYGFMETPNVPKILEHCRRKGLDIDAEQSSFFLSRRSLRPAGRGTMPAWQARVFIALVAIAEDATTYFRIPRDRVIEIGTQVAI